MLNCLMSTYVETAPGVVEHRLYKHIAFACSYRACTDVAQVLQPCLRRPNYTKSCTYHAWNLPS